MDSLHPAMDQFERPDPVLTNKIVTQLKSQGIFDQFRRECMADVDTKPAYQNLRQRVEGSVAAFLKKNPWRPDMNKNQLRDNLRKHIQSGGFLDIGVDRIVDQVVNPKIYTVFLPKVEEVVHNCLGMNNDKPKTDLAPYDNAMPEPPKFQNKHNLAPRARIPAPLTGPRVPTIPNIEALKPPEPVKSANKDTNDTEQLKASDSPEEPADDKYVVDEDDAEEVVEEEEDEESPPFEPVSETDRMILGVHTDSSEENSDESRIGVVTGSGGEDSDDSDTKQAIREKELSEEREKTESEKERSDSDEKEKSENEEKEISDIEEKENPERSGVQEKKILEHEKGSESEEKDDVKKDLDYSSDEYVPKTPTINLESSDGTVIEFNSISEYKQYQSKYDEDSLGNVEEEVVSSQWVDESSNAAKEYRSSNEDDSGGGLQKRKLMDHFDDASSSSVDKGSTSDEGKSDNLYMQKKIKVEEEPDSETTYNEDSNTEKSCDMSDHKHKPDSDHKRRHTSSTSSKDSGRSHHRHEGHIENSRHHSSLNSSREKEPREGSVSSSHSSKDKRDGRKESKHDNSKYRHRDSRKSEPLASKSHDSSRSKHSDKKEKDEETKRTEKSEDVKKETVEVEKYKSEPRHEHRDKSKTHQDKEKKKHESQDKQSPGKRDQDSSYKHDKDKRDDSRSSKHSHSSSRHRSSADKYKSEKEKHKECTSDKKQSHDKKSDKDSKKRHREHCKTSDIDNEGRRSTDRDSNGPGGKSYSHSSSTSRSTSSRSRAVDKTIYTGNRGSNSDNTVSDNVDAPREDLFDQGIASPDPEPMEDTWSEPHLAKSEVNEPRQYTSDDHKLPKGEIDENTKLNVVDECSKSFKSAASSVPQKNSCTSKTVQSKTCKLKELRIEIEKMSDNHESILNYVAGNTSSESLDENDQDFPTTSVHDTSSEKENIEQVVNCNDKNNTIETLQVDEKLPKFKKPKIAANIFEVRKIMQARRRLEKKRIKLLMKNNIEECPILESTPSKPDTKETLPEEFMGFDDVTSNKIETYDLLIQRLSSELSTSVANLCDNPNLITSWIDVNPELDDYIENVLKGKVNRKMRVRLPKISDEHYKFDSNENAYILIQNTSEEPSVMENNQLVDKNLNNLNPSLTSHESNNQNFAEIDKQNKLNTFNISTSKSIIQGGLIEETDKTTSKRKLPKQSSESPVLEKKREKLHSKRDYSNSVSDAIETNGKPVFSLTFNQTYDEILKEKTQTTSLVASKMLKDEVHKNPRTVVKITNNETSEQLVVKPVQSSGPDKLIRITKSEAVLNGKVSNDSQGKTVPLISRINKNKNVVVTPVSANKTAKVNGIVPPDSTMFEAAVIENISQTMINSVIGIQSPSKCGGAAINRETTTRENHVQKIQRETRGSTGQRGPQHYDSSDLYKPRLQLSSRRVRSQLTPDDCTPSSVLAGRKRPIVMTAEVATPKRRR